MSFVFLDLVNSLHDFNLIVLAVRTAIECPADVPTAGFIYKLVLNCKLYTMTQYLPTYTYTTPLYIIEICFLFFGKSKEENYTLHRYMGV